ncbi:hypothetical protein HEP_00465600, partial [Hepatocystis sp. ex Piliocolobus tephrosceles]
TFYNTKKGLTTSTYHKTKVSTDVYDELISNMSESSDYEQNSSDALQKSFSQNVHEKKKKKLSEQVTCDIKKLKKIFKEKRLQLLKKKKNNNLSIIVISDINLNQFDISLTRAGRFFHYIKYI